MTYCLEGRKGSVPEQWPLNLAGVSDRCFAVNRFIPKIGVSVRWYSIINPSVKLICHALESAVAGPATLRKGVRWSEVSSQS
jgi:hypothetical protein